MKTIVWLAATVLLVAGGCNHNPSGPMDVQSVNGPGISVKVTAAPTTQVSPAKFSALTTVDSITVTGTTLVIERISFVSDVDTVHPMDSTDVEKDDDGSDHHGEGGDSQHIRFKGPFVVELQNNTPAFVALDTIPAGTYNGIRFSIHRVSHNDVTKNPTLPDSLLGYSIVVVGTVRHADSSIVPFEFKTDINEEFKVKGNFVVLPGDKNVPYALNFDIGSWFKDSSGKTLDPNNMMDRFRIRQMIRAALGGHMRGGRDNDHDGEAD